MRQESSRNISFSNTFNQTKKNNKIARFYVTLTGKTLLPGFYLQRLLIN